MPEPIVLSAEESMEVPPNPENGNVPAEADGNGAPPPIDGSNPANPPTPANPPAPTEPELFELPDGRKVDGATLTKEWKENFLPDYTRKSQELASKTNPPASDPNLNSKPTDPFADPNFVPQSYAELAEAIRAGTLKEIEAREQKAADDRKAVEDAVSTQLTELKTTDPTLNENALFQHALKYGFRDLKAAYQNMSDMNKLAKDVKVATAKDINKRNDPVAGNPSATGSRLNPSHFATAVDFLRAQTGQQ